MAIGKKIKMLKYIFIPNDLFINADLDADLKYNLKGYFIKENSVLISDLIFNSVDSSNIVGVYSTITVINKNYAGNRLNGSFVIILKKAMSQKVAYVCNSEKLTELTVVLFARPRTHRLEYYTILNQEKESTLHSIINMVSN